MIEGQQAQQAVWWGQHTTAQSQIAWYVWSADCSVRSVTTDYKSVTIHLPNCKQHSYLCVASQVLCDGVVPNLSSKAAGQLRTVTLGHHKHVK